ncbi:FAD-binding protein [Chloroflexota bacterium]
MKYETDVLVVGMGFAGLCAANRAAELGVKVILIEKLSKGYWIPGGALVTSGQGIHIGGLSLMEPEATLITAIEQATSKRASPLMVNTYVGNAHRAIEWLKSCGVEFEEETEEEKTLKPKKEDIVNKDQWGLIKPGGKYDATNYGGKVASEIMLSRLNTLGAKILMETSARKLLTGAKGEVVGIVAKDKDGLFGINAKSVILCTGGMYQNQEMMVRYCGPQVSQVLPYGPPGATGDGHEMAREIGAAFRHPGIVGGVRACPEDAVWNDDHYYNDLQAVAYQGVLLDEYGDRIFDESTFVEQKMAFQYLMKHTESVTGMIVIDRTIYEQSDIIRTIISRILEFKGTVYKANTLEEIGEQASSDEKLGLRLGRQQNLVNTIKRYNKAIEDGNNMDMRPSRKTNLNKIETPPIYAIPYTLVSILSLGGLVVNEKAEVIDKSGYVIPGLYTAGELMHNSIGGGPTNTLGHETSYVGCLGLCLVFGILSAENAVSVSRQS